MSSKEHVKKSLNSQTRVAVIHDWIFERRSREKTLERILNLFPQADLYYLFGDPKKVLHLNNTHKMFPSFLSKIPYISKLYKFFLFLFPVAIENFNLKNYDLIISTSSCVAKGIIPHPHSKHVCYIHSPMRYIWDQEHCYFNKKIGLLNPIETIRRICLSKLRVWDVTSTIRIDKLIADSQFVARRCQLYYGKNPEVIYPPVDTQLFKETNKLLQGNANHRSYLLIQKNEEQEKESKDVLKSRKVLLFGEWTPHKKMLSTLKLLVDNQISVIAAGNGEELKIAHKKYKHLVEFHFSPSDQEVQTIFSKAHTVLIPAVEDFGLISLEATATGLWVVAPNSGGTKETVVNNVTGFTFDENNSIDLLRAVRAALKKDIFYEDYDELENYVSQFSPEIFDVNILSAISSCYLS